MTWQTNLRIAAEEVIRLRQKVEDLRNAGEDDPMTSEYKVADTAFTYARERFHDLAKPREILKLLEAIEGLPERISDMAPKFGAGEYENGYREAVSDASKLAARIV